MENKKNIYGPGDDNYGRDKKPWNKKVDELNLDERAVEDATAEQLRDWLTICKKSRDWNRAELLKAHHNHASFVALVEGEIERQNEHIKVYGRDSEHLYCSIILTDLLNKIK